MGCCREGVRQGAAKGCDKCNVLPRTGDELCIPCGRRAINAAVTGIGIQELKVDGRTFKYRAFLELTRHVVVDSYDQIEIDF